MHVHVHLHHSPGSFQAAEERGKAASRLCYALSKMAKKQGSRGATETFSVSVDRETRRLLKRAADLDHGGNVSALVTELAREAARRNAAGEFLRSVGIPRMTDAQAEAFEREIASEIAVQGKRRTRRASKRTAA